MVEEARLEQLEAGLTPVTEGWFVVNVRDATWVTSEVLGSACTFEATARRLPGDRLHARRAPAGKAERPLPP